MQATIFEKHPPAESVVDHSLADTRLACYWIEDIEHSAARYPALPGPCQADDVVVGGGYAGLWTAIKLKTEHPERRVVLLEAKRIGWAASGRNGGFCEASITHGEPNAESRWPDEVDVLRRLGYENLDAIERFIEQHDLDVEFERTGQLSVANEPYQLDWIGESHDPLVQALDAAQVQRLIASPTFLGGEFSPLENANVHPAKLAAELARHAHDIGVEIHEQTRVLSLHGQDDEPLQLETERGTVTAERAALCTNVFPSLLKRYVFHTVPVYDYVLMTEPLTKQQLESIGWEGRQGLADMANQFHYSRLTKDNRILWGGYDAVYHYGSKIDPALDQRPETFRTLATHFFDTFPQLEGLRFTHTWGGVIDTCSRFFPFFGTGYGGRVAYAIGYTGLGVGATRFGAQVMLDLLSGESSELTGLHTIKGKPVPFPPEPLRSAVVNLTRWSVARADARGGHRNLWLHTLDRFGLGFDS